MWLIVLVVFQQFVENIRIRAQNQERLLHPDCYLLHLQCSDPHELHQYRRHIQLSEAVLTSLHAAIILAFTYLSYFRFSFLITLKESMGNFQWLRWTRL